MNRKRYKEFWLLRKGENQVACRVTLNIVLLATIFVIVHCSGAMRNMDSAAESRTPRVVGGPCTYKEYKGKATIVSVSKKETPENHDRQSYQAYEVKFVFFPKESITEAHGRIEGRQYTMMLKNSSYPGPKFLEKYGIETGRSFECFLKVITKGTCTPLIFEFPTVDLGDYFEQKS